MKIRVIKEEPYIDVSKVPVGKVDIEPGSGAKSTLSSVDPETGKMTWDVEYKIDPKHVYEKLDDIVRYMDRESLPKGSDFDKIKDIIKKVKNQVHRLM